MRSWGGLFDRIISTETLQRSLWAAVRGKPRRPSVQRFIENAAGEIAALHEELASGTYRPRPYGCRTGVSP